MIEVKKLRFDVGNRRILDSIDFCAHPGEILSIIGPNGAGKSTLLKLLSKQLKLQNGEIIINNKSLVDFNLEELAKFRAVLAQSHQMNINLRVFEVALMGRYPFFANKPAQVDIDVTNQALEEMGLLALRDRSIHHLSGGEQQRVHLARVMAQIAGQQQGILFMDEPITGLDLKYQHIIMDKALQLAQAGVTVISILHDINLAAKYASKILVLKNGQNMGYGIPNDILTAELVSQTYETQVKRIQENSLSYPVFIPL